MPKRMFPAKDVPFGGLDYIWLHSGGQTPKMGRNRHFTARSAM